jgi:hypothetical protein
MHEEFMARLAAGSPLLRLAVVAAVFWLDLALPGRAGTIVNFETNPSLPTQPSTFVAAGAAQTYTQAGVFTISGGVALGNPTFLTAFAAHGSVPNLYGSTDIADPSLLNTITLALPAAEQVINVAGVLFNGQPASESYTVTATLMSGGTQMQNFTLPASNSSSGFANFSLSSVVSNPITQVKITTPNAGVNGWDFLVDTIQINTVPEPSALVQAATGGLALLGFCCSRYRRASVRLCLPFRCGQGPRNRDQ